MSELFVDISNQKTDLNRLTIANALFVLVGLAAAVLRLANLGHLPL